MAEPPQGPKKLLFVCSGNACRSPMAMIVAEQLEAKKGIPIIANSAAGKIVDGRFEAYKSTAKFGVRALEGVFDRTRLEDYQPKPLTEELIREADYVIFLGEKYRKNAEEHFGETLEGKAMYYCTYKNQQDPNDKERHEVPDPFNGESWPEYYNERPPGTRMFGSYQKVLNSMINEFYPQLREQIFGGG